MGSDSAPAAPLEKAVEEHRAALNSERNCRVGCVHLDEVLRTGDALLAAIDADKRLEEALAAEATNAKAAAYEHEQRAVAEARLERIGCYAGERCEASGCRPDPCGPVEYHDVEGVPLCAECWQECCDEAADARRYFAEKGERNG